MSDFLMPSLGADMESATVVEWLVKVGETISRGQVIAVVETEKGLIDIEVFEDGTIEELVAPLEVEIPVGAVIARIHGTGEAAVATPLPPTAVTGPAIVEVPAPVRAPPPLAARVPGTRVSASPLARRRAVELGVDLGAVQGTGVGGAICLADVERAAAAAPAAPAAPAARVGGFEPGAMRRAIASAMTRAKREIPHYYLSHQVSLATALAWIEAQNLARPVTERLLPAVLFLKASALALRKVPELNGFYEQGRFRAGSGIHIGWAVALRGGGLIAPAIHDADRLDIGELMAKLRGLVQRARGGGLRSSELMDPTITLTSLGERSAAEVLPIIYPPQVAVIGFGAVVERPWVVDGRVEPAPVLTVSLAADHRVSDGHRGGQLLAEIERLLMQPEKL